MEESSVPRGPVSVSYSAEFVRLKQSIFDEGPNPAYHRARIRQMKRECPVVWDAILGLIGPEPDWCRET